MRAVRQFWRHPVWWLSAALFALNAAIAWPLFQAEYLSQTGTGESLTIAYARYARDHWPDLGWCRFWFGGMPFQNAYVPGLHFTVAAVSYFTHITAALAFHHVVAVMYCLGPVTLFWMACRLTGAVSWSFYAGLLYSLISPSAFLIPEIHRDLGSFFWDQRLHVMPVYGDNPHVSALTLLPLAILALDVALQKRRPIFYVMGALAAAAVPLTNWPGAIAFTFALGAYCLSNLDAGWLGRWLRIAGMGALAYGLAVPWIPPSTIFSTQRAVQAYDPVRKFNPHHLLYILALGAATWIILWLLSVVRTPQYLRFFLLFFFYMGTITLAWYWYGISLLAEAHRFHMAMEMGLILSLVFGVRLLVRRFVWLGKPLAVAFTALCVVQFVQFRGYARGLIHAIDITKTSEYKTARWFDQHMPDSRVMVPGSTTFWLNVFTDTPQFAGCCTQSVRSQTYPVASYGITTDLTAENRASENSVLWFKALGVRAVAVSGPRSTEVYKPFWHPRKFEGHLPVLWQDGDDVIYGVPWRHYSIAHAIAPSEQVQRAPIHGVDSGPLAPYVDAIDRPDAAELKVQWPNNETMIITGEVKAGQIVSVQENEHPGWHASVGGAPRRLYADKLGLMAVEPQCSGNCRIELHYDGGMEMRLAHWLNRGAILGALLWVILGLARRKRAPHPPVTMEPAHESI